MSLRGLCLIALPLLPGMLACSPAIPSGGSPPSHDSQIVAIHLHKCGKCHVPPEPRTRTREHLVSVFLTHRNRVHLTPDEWSAMVDYLAAPAGQTALQPR
jgi:hypothetical protein